MTEATFTYLNHRIEIQLPDPTKGSTVEITFYRLPGTYDDALYHAFVTN